MYKNPGMDHESVRTREPREERVTGFLDKPGDTATVSAQGGRMAGGTDNTSTHVPIRGYIYANVRKDPRGESWDNSRSTVRGTRPHDSPSDSVRWRN